MPATERGSPRSSSAAPRNAARRTCSQPDRPSSTANRRKARRAGPTRSPARRNCTGCCAGGHVWATPSPPPTAEPASPQGGHHEPIRRIGAALAAAVVAVLPLRVLIALCSQVMGTNTARNRRAHGPPGRAKNGREARPGIGHAWRGGFVRFWAGARALAGWQRHGRGGHGHRAAKVPSGVMGVVCGLWWCASTAARRC
jgi:hypothetical protein